ncbi:MAG: hypothetical protein JOY62_10115 [Acidobacteriaceae bacterium]|nr:hypothetical protein [Acidobacteriaceae bacterium]MBV9780313.1 hypothetical protein [Acidobacteriaceae bacterium]
MTCFSAKRQSTVYTDGRLRGSDFSRVAAHLRACDSCSVYFDQIAKVRSATGELSGAKCPTRLSLKLRVIASRERKAVEENNGSRFRAMWKQWRFRLDEILKPLTLPATGGLLSSFILFGILAFTIGTASRAVNYEVPVVYEEQPGVNLVPLQLGADAVVLTISTDNNGRIRDYAVRDGSDSFAGDPGKLQSSSIALPRFPSVLAVAHPVSGDISISFTPLELRQ